MAVRSAGGENGVSPAAERPPEVRGTVPGDDAQADLRRQLARRMGVAAMLIVVLLAALATFDYLNTQEEALVSGAQFTEPVPVRKREAVPLPAALPPAGDRLGEPPPPMPPAVTEQGSSTPSVVSSDSAVQPSTVASGAVAARQTPASGLSVGSTMPVRAPGEAPVQSAPTASLTAGAAPPAVPAASAPRLLSGYILQSDLLLDVRRAESLQARLAQEGIPATVETRLRIGPFRTRAESEAVRHRLKELGIETAPLAGKGR